MMDRWEFGGGDGARDGWECAFVGVGCGSGYLQGGDVAFLFCLSRECVIGRWRVCGGGEGKRGGKAGTEWLKLGVRVCVMRCGIIDCYSMKKSKVCVWRRNDGERWEGMLACVRGARFCCC